jgi:hypothetical protein
MASMTRRLVEAYAADEPWKVDHDGAMACRDTEDVIANGISLFQRIVEVDVKSQADGRGASEEVVESCWAEVESLYRSWLGASLKSLARAERLVNEGYDVEGLDEFRATIEDASNVVGNAELEKGIRPLDELKAMAKPDNPRPERYRD